MLQVKTVDAKHILETMKYDIDTPLNKALKELKGMNYVIKKITYIKSKIGPISAVTSAVIEFEEFKI